MDPENWYLTTLPFKSPSFWSNWAVFSSGPGWLFYRDFHKPLFWDPLGLPPSQDSSHHQDYEPFLGSGIPT